LGDAGEKLDDQAKAAYRQRLSDLREELEEAKERGNVERAEQAEQEIDALTREISRAVRLGGRNRQAASASERARQSLAMFSWSAKASKISSFHAMMLIDRAATGHYEKARTLLSNALKTYTQIGMPRHVEITQALLARAAGSQQ